jgi:hypothetical protein
MPGDATADVPGAPRTPTLIYRRLLEDGYEVSAPIVQKGPVYFVHVHDRRSQPLCLVLDAFTGTILQGFAYTPQGPRALNDDSPGPGFPGYPPYPDARFAGDCNEAAPAPVVVPGSKIIRPIPKPRVIAHIRRRAHMKHSIKPVCGPYQAPAKKPPGRQPIAAKHPAPRRPQLCVRPTI